jgi:DNA-binding NtrC family response regulator
MPRQVLIVEPDPTILSSLLQAISSAEAEGCATFSSARAQLFSNQYGRLVTNLRLQAHNGLHLVYLARVCALNTRCVVYTERLELTLAQEVQKSGAFYEFRERLQHAIRAYIESDLPPSDRRHPFSTSRRAVSRGGRRYSDQPIHATQ